MEAFTYGNVDTCVSTVCYNFPASLREEDHSAFNLLTAKDWKYVRSRYFRTQPSANFHCRVAPSNNRPWFLLRISKINPNPSVFCFLSVRVRTINATEALHSIHNISSQELLSHASCMQVPLIKHIMRKNGCYIRSVMQDDRSSTQVVNSKVKWFHQVMTQSLYSYHYHNKHSYVVATTCVASTKGAPQSTSGTIKLF